MQENINYYLDPQVHSDVARRTAADAQLPEFMVNIIMLGTEPDFEGDTVPYDLPRD